MRRPNLVLCLFQFCLSLTGLGAQDDGCTGPNYAQFFRDVEGRDVRLTCILPYRGEIILGGMIGGDLYLSQLDTEGNLRWRTALPTGSESTELSTLNALYAESDGTISGVGSVFVANRQYGFIMRYDPVRDRFLYFHRNEDASDLNALLPGGAGDYLAAGARLDFPAPEFMRAYVQRFDRATGLPQGDAIVLDEDGDERVFDMVGTPEGGFLAAGQAVRGGGAGAVRATLSELNAAGAPVRTQLGPVNRDENARLFGYDVERVGDITYLLQWGDIGVLTGSANTKPILSAFEPDGGVLWTREFDLREYPGEAGLEMEAHGDGLLIYGYALGAERDIFLLHTDLQGQVRWARSYVFPGRVLVYARANQQLQAAGDRIRVVATNTFSGGRPHESLLLQLDGEGNALGECVDQRTLDVREAGLASGWSGLRLEQNTLPTRYATLPSERSDVSLVVVDDCDVPCEFCPAGTIRRMAICPGDSVRLGGQFRKGAGVYIDTIESNEAGCDSTVATLLDVAAPLVATYDQISACGLRTALITVAAAGGVPPYRYRWNVPGVEGPQVDLPEGEFIVSVTDSFGCQTVDLAVSVRTGSGALRIVAEPPSCFGALDGSIRIEPAGSGSLRLLTDSVFVPDELTGLASGSYSFILRAGDSCEAFRQISLPFSPFLQVGIDGPERVSLGTEASFTAELRARVGPIRYDWAPGGEPDCTDCFSTALTVTEDTTVRLTVTDGNGCTASDSLRVRITDPPSPIYVPTGFSPNGDGTNDTWIPGLNSAVAAIQEWKVYDRWGGEVWEWEGRPWDGGRAAAGVYVYRMTVRLVDGRVVHKTGQVHLIR
jgi:hypothetical protein